MGSEMCIRDRCNSNSKNNKKTHLLCKYPTDVLSREKKVNSWANHSQLLTCHISQVCGQSPQTSESLFSANKKTKTKKTHLHIACRGWEVSLKQVGGGGGGCGGGGRGRSMLLDAGHGSLAFEAVSVG